MSRSETIEVAAAAIRASGLIPPGSRGVALLSGGADSACLAAGLVEVLGAERIQGLHVNYGFRTDSGEDQGACEALCERLGIELSAVRVALDTDSRNLQAAARETRYDLAQEELAQAGGEWIATGHTRTDRAETMLYRLAVSPGRRALLGLPARRGSVVRPLLELSRSDTRELAAAAGLPFRDDPSNVDPRFSRVRIREEVLPVLRELNPAAERNAAATWAELAEEAEALEGVVKRELGAIGAGEGATAVQAEALGELHPALRRLALRQLAERAAGWEVPLSRERAAEIWRLANEPEGGEVELGSGFSAICEAGLIRFRAGPVAIPAEVIMRVPGSCRWGRWELRAELSPAPPEPGGPEIAVLDAEALGEAVDIRAWRDGDRMRPLGLDGSKSLQDLFTDRRVPRSLRHSLPVVTRGERIVWVAGVAVSEEFRAGAAAEAAVLSAALAD